MGSLMGDGCTTNNGEYIYHFNHGVEDYNATNSVQSTLRYDPKTNEWQTMTGNPNNKFNPACAADVSGRYIYLIGGTSTYENIRQEGEVELATDRYDTVTDTWERLDAKSDYPERFGRDMAIAITDSTTNQIMVVGGEIFDD